MATSLRPSSQDIARDVLASPSVSAFPSSNSTLDPLKQVLRGDMGQTTPIPVSIVERMSKKISNIRQPTICYNRKNRLVSTSFSFRNLHVFRFIL